MTLPALGTRVVFCRYSPLLYRFKTLSSWAAVSSIPQWSSPLKAEEKNYLDEEQPAQDKTRFNLNEALSMGVPQRPAPWQGGDVGRKSLSATGQVSHQTQPRHSRGWLTQLLAPGLQAQSTEENSSGDQHQPIQGTPKLCLLISFSPASLIFPSDAHWSKALKNPQISVTGNYSCLKAILLVISEDLWKCHLWLWLLK